MVLSLCLHWASPVYKGETAQPSSPLACKGSLNSPQRHGESTVLRLCWTQLGFPLVAEVGRLSPTARLEGGDFFPLGPRLSLIGVGLRTNMEAVQHLVHTHAHTYTHTHTQSERASEREWEVPWRDGTTKVVLAKGYT